ITKIYCIGEKVDLFRQPLPWMKSMVKMKSEYDFGGIFGQRSKNHDKIPSTSLRSREMHFFAG
ncbi:MAG TPA: hypothetical protein PLZ32_09115, partial [Saprospiraceae bacterium]|nr:hypothetical protein [Saprospiraceae bacterium]